VTAQPPIPSSAAPLTDKRDDRPDRSEDRPSTPPTKSAAEKAEEAAKKKAAEEKKAQQEAAEKKAAAEKKKAAEKKAAELKKAQEKDSDDDSKGAGSDEGESDKKDESGGSEEKSGDSGSDQDAEQDTYRAPTDWEVVGDRYVTTALNLRVEPSTDGEVVKVLPEGEKVKATSTKEGKYTLVVYNDKPRWLATEYLSKTKPEPEEKSDSGSDDDGISYEPCPSGSRMENGLTKDAIRVHRAICHKFPFVTDYIGIADGNGYHPSGRAVDAMVSGDRGWEVARWVRANAKALGVSEVIHAQKIWTVQRSSEGWRSMEDRGSVSANHYDHVHISVYGNSGSS